MIEYFSIKARHNIIGPSVHWIIELSKWLFTSERACENQCCSNPTSGFDLGASLKFHIPSKGRVSLNFVFFGYITPYWMLPWAPTLHSCSRRKVNEEEKWTDPCRAFMTLSAVSLYLDWGLTELKANTRISIGLVLWINLRVLSLRIIAANLSLHIRVHWSTELGFTASSKLELLSTLQDNSLSSVHLGAQVKTRNDYSKGTMVWVFPYKTRKNYRHHHLPDKVLTTSVL